MLGDFLIVLKNSWIGQLYQISYSYEVFLFVVAYLSAFFVIKKRWLKIVFLNSLHLILVFILIRAYLLNEDICIEQGRKLTDKEKMDSAVDYIIQSYPPNKIEQYVDNPEEKFSEYDKWYYVENPTNTDKKNKILYYPSRELFYQENSGCCALSNTAAPLKWKGFDSYSSEEWGWPVDFHARVRWQYSVWAHITYRVKYLNSSKQESYIIDEKIIPVSQCGIVLEPKSIVEDY